jgi:predicted nucleotidyltransferase component of viral defense system
MIPRAEITAWRNKAPWQADEQVEQDLLICRALIEIFSDSQLSENLAFRGGTALHKLHLNPQARYSEDIDLVQTKPGAIGVVIDRLRKKLDFLGEPRINQKKFNNTIIFRYESEVPPVISMKLKVEINCREHFTVYGYKKFPFSISTGWFKGKCEITTFDLNEMLGTKMRALYQRKKGRDLFDLYHALSEAETDPSRIVNAFKHYMEQEGHKVSRKEFILNMEAKMKEAEFTGDISSLLRPELKFGMQEAWEVVRESIIELL